MVSYGQSSYKIYGHAGKTMSWCPSDSEDRFDANMADPKNKVRLERNGWTKDSISYTFNSDGFRSEEFTYEPNDSILFLGCSLTVGIGVDLETSWAYMVASRLGLRRYNLGVGAGGPDMCFRLAYHWIPRLQPKYVAMLTPDAARIEIVTDNQSLTFIPSNTKNDDFYTTWLSHPANAEMNRLRSVMGVQMICNSIGVPLVEIPVEKCYTARDSKESWIRDLIRPDRVKSQIGRDLMHPGGYWHDQVADRFLQELMVIHGKN